MIVRGECRANEPLDFLRETTKSVDKFRKVLTLMFCNLLKGGMIRLEEMENFLKGFFLFFGDDLLCNGTLNVKSCLIYPRILV